MASPLVELAIVAVRHQRIFLYEAYTSKRKLRNNWSALQGLRGSQLLLQKMYSICERFSLVSLFKGTIEYD